MSVSLRIVGIYYNQSDIPFKENMTVMDVLNYARFNPSDNAKVFGFETGQLQIGSDSGKPSISSFYSEYNEPFQSKTSGLMKQAGPTCRKIFQHRHPLLLGSIMFSLSHYRTVAQCTK